MEETTSEVVEGSKLAGQAGEALADIDSVSNRLAELINSISFATKQQARGGLLVSRSIKEVSSVIHETAAATKNTAASVGRLATLAENLRSSVSRFRLPQDIGSSTAAMRDSRPASARDERGAPLVAVAEYDDRVAPRYPIETGSRT
jgi:twitching motility protein PilJ